MYYSKSQLVGLSLALLTGAFSASAAETQWKQPIIDMHVHIAGVTAEGEFEWYSPVPPNPFTGQPTGKFTEDGLMHYIFDELERYRVVKAVVSSNLHHTARALKAYPDVVIPAVVLGGGAPRQDDSLTGAQRLFDPTVEALRKEIQGGRVRMLGEIFPEYFGARLTDQRYEPYYSLAEEMDIPVAMHTGLAAAPIQVEAAGLRTVYRGDFGNPAGFEAVLNAHPRLRVYLMHAGHPYFAETYAILQSYPHVYVDIAYIAYLLPGKEFHRYLKQLIESIQGMDKRVMFGTDVYLWREGVKATIDAIEAADYLTRQQKADIYCNNAARFLRLDERICSR